jgi:hypothetical protein
MVVFFVIMLFVYRALAAIEERECLGKFGEAYSEYLQRTPRFVPFGAVPKGWPSGMPLLARFFFWTLGFSATMLTALAFAFVLQTYTLQHLYTVQADGIVYLSLAPLDKPELQRIVQTALDEPRVYTRVNALAGPQTRFIAYVMPWEWEVPEVPMNAVSGHRAPENYDRRRHKVTLNIAVLRGNLDVQGLDILRQAIRTEPVAEAWIDAEGRVSRVLGPPKKTFYGTLPVPVF